jgi:hypothetical protein
VESRLSAAPPGGRRLSTLTILFVIVWIPFSVVEKFTQQRQCHAVMEHQIGFQHIDILLDVLTLSRLTAAF